jgi:plastocyanin
MNKGVIAIIIIAIVAIGAGVLLWKSPTSPTTSDRNTAPMDMKGMDNSATAPAPTPDTSTPTDTTTGQTSTDTSTSNIKEFTVTGQNFSFSPSTMTVNKGDKVRIIFKNSGGTHNLVIDEFNVETKTIGSGKEDVVEFTADKTGSFQYYCDIGNHRAMGMWGTLMVK